MKRYNIVKPRKYIDSQNQERTYWDKVGEMVEFPKEDGSVNRIVKIPAIGLEANVFEEKPKEEPRKESVDKTMDKELENYGRDYPEETINANDIPF